MQNSQVKNRLQHRRFSVNFAEFINNTSFKERLRWLLVFGMYDLLRNIFQKVWMQTKLRNRKGANSYNSKVIFIKENLSTKNIYVS